MTCVQFVQFLGNISTSPWPDTVTYEDCTPTTAWLHELDATSLNNVLSDSDYIHIRPVYI